MYFRATTIGALLFASNPAAALDNGLARTPPMGWNSWNRFRCDVSEKVVREIADAIVASGMRDAGYRYVVVDDCWQQSRAADGTIQADPARFPSGMKALGDYIHARGLKFGLYSAVGERTCQGRPASGGHERQDARTYAAWGVDFLKYDWCTFTIPTSDAPRRYAVMRDALAATGRPILLSMSEWGQSNPANWGPATGNMWRTTGDIADAFDREAKMGSPPGAPVVTAPPGLPAPPAGMPPLPPGGAPPPPMGLGVLQILDRQAGLARVAGPGGWNDPDMLEIGNGGMTADESRAHFALWAILGAPLIAGNDVRTMSDETRAILINREIIAVSQDPLGRAGDRLSHDGDADIWGRPLSGGGMAMALLNRGSSPRAIELRRSTLRLGEGPLALRDLWRGKDLGSLGDSRNFTVAPHSALVLKVTPTGG